MKTYEINENIGLDGSNSHYKTNFVYLFVV